MTPFGVRVRELRARKGVKLKEMAQALGVSAAYLSALEHGKRARPAPGLVRQICDYFGLIWDEADEMRDLARRSGPRVTLDTGGLSPLATEFVNTLARCLGQLPDPVLARLLAELGPAEPPSGSDPAGAAATPPVSASSAAPA